MSITPAKTPIIAALLAAGLSLGPAAAQPAPPSGEFNTDPAAAPAGAYTLDKAFSSVTMKVNHLGLSYYTLRFDTVDASYGYDPAHPEASKLQVRIDPASIDTGDPAINRQLATDLFEAARYPDIRFVSTAIRPSGEGRGTVVGDLTLHGVTRPVTLDVIFNGAGPGGDRQSRMGFSATTDIRRSDFGISKYLPAVGDEVSVLIEVEFRK